MVGEAHGIPEYHLCELVRTWKQSTESTAASKITASRSTVNYQWPMLVILTGHRVLARMKISSGYRADLTDLCPPSPRACYPDSGELSECCSSLQPSGFQLREVAARLQWMGQMWWEEATRSVERELPLSTAQGQGPGTRDHGDNDQGSGTMAESAGGEAIGTRLPRGARPSRSKAFRGRRCG